MRKFILYEIFTFSVCIASLFFLIEVFYRINIVYKKIKVLSRKNATEFTNFFFIIVLKAFTISLKQLLYIRSGSKNILLLLRILGELIIIIGCLIWIVTVYYKL